MKKTGGKLTDSIAYVLIDEMELQKRIRELGEAITAEYEDVADLSLICVLKGAYIFLADLSRAITRPHYVDFMGVSSYGAGTKSSGAVQIIMDLKEDIAGRHILIIEDIIDSGRTLAYMHRNLLARAPASLRICSLLNKPSRREVDVPVDYIGFDIPDEFVVGYGLDYAQFYRNLPYIAVLKPEIFA
ncbi:MAG: hypoxanthine phosphoribosyltransferase [Chloroflexi bacterium]|nr:hypoxanthine phosphoribosyltransferase [Chloroflexota bacterium]MBP8054197.1 hypoxanthine phosphoribosyltransferase [Chloroflexota bacterium]